MISPLHGPGGPGGPGKSGSGGTSGDWIKVLVVTSQERDVAALRHALAEAGATNFDLRHAPDLIAALRMVGTERFDACLADLSAEGDGDPALDVVACLRERASDVPILVLAPDDDALAVRALKAGAQDALVKARLEGSLLARAMRYAIERHQLQLALHTMALVDELTGLYNRRGFQTLARQQLKMADRLRKRVSHIFVDLDDLKAINDAFGHREGDLALIEAAELLQDTFRDSDIIARIGGDEFVVLALENVGQPPEQWAARLQENLRLRNARPGRLYRLSLSMGIAYYDPDFPCAVDDLLDRADSLMYEEKRRKRGSGGRRSGGGEVTPRYGKATPGDPGVAPRAD